MTRRAFLNLPGRLMDMGLDWLAERLHDRLAVDPEAIARQVERRIEHSIRTGALRTAIKQRGKRGG